MIFDAELFLENNNPYDAFAVRVEIGDKTVGHLSKTNALIYRENLQKSKLTKYRIKCPAKVFKYIPNSGDSEICFSLALDLPDNYCEGFETVFVNTSKDSVSLKFYLNGIDMDVLSLCKNGDRLKLWKPASNPTRIYAYIYSGGPEKARLGHIPKEYFSTILKHMNKCLDYSINIETIDKNTCHINCFLASRLDTKKRIRDETSLLRSEILRKYTPKKSFTTDVDIPISHSLHAGQIIKIRDKDTEEYIKMKYIRIEFIDENNVTVAWKNRNKFDVIKILKILHNNHKVRIKIVSINDIDKLLIGYVSNSTAKIFIDISPEP